MKRNKELIREILIFLESQNEAYYLTFEGPYDKDHGGDFSGYKTGDVSGHFKLLIDDGYLEGNPGETANNWIYFVSVQSITMKGYDLLDSIRDQGIWAEVKKELGVVGESWNIELIVKLATKIIANKLSIK